ncbi:protein of unknown function [Azospirillum baldaniorum]|uniref:Uncharacterized protein n=1 Tax=Azospirillum baldaniorum TaxID=1064539 RepID=A0A9P1NLG3_9PROT|nr:protein of unknown function [Azospirillum baldaniorum]
MERGQRHRLPRSDREGRQPDGRHLLLLIRLTEVPGAPSFPARPFPFSGRQERPSHGRTGIPPQPIRPPAGPARDPPAHRHRPRRRGRIQRLSCPHPTGDAALHDAGL